MGPKMKGTSVVALVVAFLLLPDVSRALTNDQKVLVGLRGVGVVVAGMAPQAERLGLTKVQIQTDVELRLRKAGVRVLTKKESFDTPCRPYLYVNVNVDVSQAGLPVLFSISVDLAEEVTLARGFKTDGSIWRTGSIGTVGKSNIREIREVVGDLVDKFINDYLAANPK